MVHSISQMSFEYGSFEISFQIVYPSALQGTNLCQLCLVARCALQAGHPPPLPHDEGRLHASVPAPDRPYAESLREDEQGQQNPISLATSMFTIR